MKWFKHLSSNSIQDPKLTRLLDAQGVEGYGRFYLLVECLVRSAESLDHAPTASFTVKRWAEVLRLKPKSVKAYFDVLGALSLVQWQHSESQIQASLNDWQEILSQSAISSTRRTPSGVPRKEEVKLLRATRTEDQAQRQTEDLKNNPAIALALSTDPTLTGVFDVLIKKSKVQS